MANPISFLFRRRLVRWLGVVIILLALVVYGLAPWLLRRILVREATAALGREVSIEAVSVNPFRLAVSLRGVSVADLDKSELAGWRELTINLSIASAWNGTLTFDAIRLQGARAKVAILKDGSLNLAALAKKPAQPPVAAAPAAPAAFRPVVISRLLIEDAAIAFSDDSNGKHFAARLAPIHVELENIATAGGESGECTFSASTEAGEKFAWHGRVSLAPLSSRGHVEVVGLRLGRYAPYADAVLPLHLVGGQLDVSADYSADLGKGQPVAKVSGGSIALRNFAVALPGASKDLLALDSLTVGELAADTSTREVSIGSLKIAKPAVAVDRLADGRLALPMLPAPAAAAAAAGTPAAPAPGQPTAPAPAWTVSLAALTLDHGSVRVTDASTARPVTLRVDDLTVGLGGFSTKPGNRATLTLAARLQDSGALKLGGAFGIDPVAADLDVALDGLDLHGFDPYVAALANASLESAKVRVSGHLNASMDAKGALKAEWKGGAGIADLKVIDLRNSERMLALGDASVSGVDFSLAPLRLSVDSVTVTAPSVNAVLMPDKTLNLVSCRKVTPTPAPAAPVAAQPAQPAQAAPLPEVRVGKVEVRGGSVSFEDRTFKPGFSMAVAGLDVDVRGLSSQDLAKADLDVKATVDGAPLRVQGKINPLSRDLYSDVTVSCSGIELPAFTPYSGRFVGYTISKGKLNLDLKYRLSSEVLEAENRVVLDQFYLGDSVESPEAVHLPVKLGLALLRDRNGLINVDMPIRGNLKDPDFKYGRLVWQTVGNLIVKAAASPFSLLAGLVGGKEDLSAVLFAPGRSMLDDAARGRLGLLAKALRERPGLTLEISSGAWSPQDELGLKEVALETQLRRMKWQDLAKAGPVEGDASTVTLTPEETEKYLKIAYDQAHPAGSAPVAAPAPQAKPEAASAAPSPESKRLTLWRRVLDFLRFPHKAAPATVAKAKEPAGGAGAAAPAVPAGPTLPEMRTALVEAMAVSDIDRSRLESDRRLRVREYLLTQGKIDAARLFVVAESKQAEAKPAQTGAAGAVPEVKFGLK